MNPDLGAAKPLNVLLGATRSWTSGAHRDRGIGGEPNVGSLPVTETDAPAARGGARRAEVSV